VLEEESTRFSRDNTTMRKCLQFFTLACGLIVTEASAPRAAAESVEMPSVKLRIDDYAAVATDLLARAQDGVTQLYEAIGVNTQWLKTRHLSSWPSAASFPADSGVADLTVVVLDPTMTTRIAPSPNAMGLAANAPSAQGRIVYVFYDRLRIVTRQRDVPGAAALSLVMAHEIGHLLLPYGSHTEAGVMRGHWDLEGFRHLDIGRLKFTPLQGQQIRRMLRGLRPFGPSQ